MTIYGRIEQLASGFCYTRRIVRELPSARTGWLDLSTQIVAFTLSYSAFAVLAIIKPAAPFTSHRLHPHR